VPGLRPANRGSSPLRGLAWAALCLIIPTCGISAPAPANARARLCFAGLESALPLISTSLLPGAALEIRLKAPRGVAPESYAASVETGVLRTSGPGRWEWTAPAAPGHALIHFRRETEGAPELRLRVFVLRPWNGEAQLEGFRIGSYGEDARPPGFIEVLPGDESLPVSPNFRLGEFLGKQSDGPPRYLLLETRLLLELERILVRVRNAGLRVGTFRLLSGFRTPFYNRQIGNLTTRSRHGWGDAADVFIDEDGNGRMDDLDGDGRESIEDARRLYRLIEDEVDDRGERIFVGGLGLYGPKPHRGPFVHVDVRGRNARW
jgi:hypothetical protein